MYEDGCVLERSLGLEFVRVPVRHGRGEVGRVEHAWLVVLGCCGLAWVCVVRSGLG
jgi:hypothetical protein